MNAKQLKAIELLARADKTYIEMANEIGVEVGTLRRWRKKEEFELEVRKRCRELLKEAEPMLYNAAIQAVKKNQSHQHIKILLERLERLEDISEGRGNDYNVMFTFKKKEDEDAIQPPPQY